VTVGLAGVGGPALAPDPIVSGIVQSLMAWLAEHTYAVVFVATLIDATALPFPGRIVLAAAGAFAAAGGASVALVIGLGTAGVLVTDHVWYFAGARGGDRLLRLYCRLTLSSPDCVRRATDWLQRFGPLVILVGRFVAAVRVLAWPLARARGLGYARFLVVELPAAVAWTAVWVGFGWLLGERWAQASAEARWIGVALALAAALVVFLVRRRRRARATAPRETAAPASRGSLAGPRARPRP
jgi:membrane protein DedA with SNARE-associated domain